VKPKVDRRTRDWYSVSIDTLRAWGSVLALAVMVALGYFGYRYWESYDLERRAAAVIDDARRASNRLQGVELPESFRNDHRKAGMVLTQATAHLSEGELGPAYARGRESLEILESILNATGRGGGLYVAQILSLAGRVEVRRDSRDDWEEARALARLYSGDQFRTGASGSARLLFTDGNYYDVRPNTQFVLTRDRGEPGRGGQRIGLDYGWVNLNTKERGGTVATPGAEARVAGETEASVSYDAETGSGRFATIRGTMEVASSDGTERRVGELEEVLQERGVLGEPGRLPPPPPLAVPEDNLELEAGRHPQLVLAWQPVEGAESYALQVSASSLFVDNVIDVEGRRNTRARLGVRGEGLFHWRVAASGPGGALGPWSATRRFRVTTATEERDGEEREPPPLTIDGIESYGSIFLVQGRTEPGISLTINGEPVGVDANGEFNKTVQFTNPGWSFIEVRARDGLGAEAVVTRRVHVDIL
jgi:hypothetical protein